MVPLNVFSAASQNLYPANRLQGGICTGKNCCFQLNIGTSRTIPQKHGDKFCVETAMIMYNLAFEVCPSLLYSEVPPPEMKFPSVRF